MIKLEINNKKYKVPTSFDELTLEQYCKIFYKLPTFNDEDDDVTKFKKMRECESIILSRLLGEKDDFCLDLPLPIYAKLNEAVKFLYDIERFLINAKAGITIDHRRYAIPPMQEMPLRQYIDADMVMQEEENNMQYIELLSILLTAKDANGKWIPYNGDYEEMFGKVRNLSCEEALPLVFHFFKKSEISKRLSQISTMGEAQPQLHQHIQNS